MPSTTGIDVCGDFGEFRDSGSMFVGRTGVYREGDEVRPTPPVRWISMICGGVWL